MHHGNLHYIDCAWVITLDNFVAMPKYVIKRELVLVTPTRASVVNFKGDQSECKSTITMSESVTYNSLG